MENHVHRFARLGQSVLINCGWYKLALGRKGYVDWPLGLEAKAALAALALGKAVRLHAGTTPFDRYGRILAQAYAERPEGALWLQGVMIEQGMARVYSFKDNRACAAELLARERHARAARRGLWALPYYAVRQAESLSRAEAGEFFLVEGRILEVAEFKDRAYLNYGRDYRTDFTGVIEGTDLALFRAEGYDLKKLRGQSVRVRGWLELRNGPMIAISHPEQIEKLDEEGGGNKQEDNR